MGRKGGRNLLPPLEATAKAGKGNDGGASDKEESVSGLFAPIESSAEVSADVTAHVRFRPNDLLLLAKCISAVPCPANCSTTLG